MSKDLTTETSQDNTGADAGEQGSETTATWTDSLPEELRSNEELSAMEGPDQLAQKYLDLKSAQPVLPENPDGYSYEFPEDAQFNDESHKEFKVLAHESGLTEEQFSRIVDFDLKRSQEALEQYTRQKDEALATMQKEYGDKYEENLDLANKVLENFDALGVGSAEDPTDAKRLLGNNPQFFKFLVNIGKAISEDTLEKGAGSSAGDSRPKDETGAPRLRFPSMGE